MFDVLADGSDIQITSVSGFNQVVFKEYANASVSRKFTSLFPGLGYAAGYKVRGPRYSNFSSMRTRLTDF